MNLLFHHNLVVVITSLFGSFFVLQLLNVYAAKYETGGKFWPIVHSSTIFSLVLMHIIAIGLFGLKELPWASSLTIPLPILTVLFSIYCQRRFLPNFKCYPTEVNALEMGLKIIALFSVLFGNRKLTTFESNS